MINSKEQAVQQLERDVINQAVIDTVECCRGNSEFNARLFATENQMEVLDLIHEFYDLNEFGGLCEENGDRLERLFPNFDDRCDVLNKFQTAIIDTIFDISRLPVGFTVNRAMNLIKMANS